MSSVKTVAASTASGKGNEVSSSPNFSMSCSCAADKGGGDELGEDSTGLYDPEMEEEKLCGSIAANSLVSRSCKLKL